MISRTAIGKKGLTFFTRFLASTIQSPQTSKEKSYRMPDIKKKEQSEEVRVEETEKSYRMPEEEIILPFRPTAPIRMHNYRVLLYMNKQRLTTPQLLQVPHAAAFFSLIYLIRYNPWYMTFPASLPIMIGTEIFVFFSWIFNKKHYKYIIERVYLYNSNKIEFTFSNKIRRKLKNTEDCHMFQGPEDVKTPSHNEDGSLAWSQKGAKFPEKLDYVKNPKTNEIEFAKPELMGLYGWTKYTNNYTPYIFPKSYEYCNWEVLVPLLSGRYIDIEFGTNELHQDMDTIKENASFEQEMAWIQSDKKKNQEYLLALKQGKQVSLN